MERILTLNIGATRLGLAEFAVNPGKAPTLLRYTFGELPEGAADSPETLRIELERALRGMMAAEAFKPGKMLVSLSGQMAFPRFIKVFADNPEQMKEQIRLEVEQALPFPLSEALWSYATVGGPSVGEQHVMIVAARADLVDAVNKGIMNAGCDPDIVDVAPVALYNAVRFNYPDADGCTLIVDIGARCTNLVFVEQDRIFYRTIPVAGNTITAEIAKNFGISPEDAEELKCTRGLVAQGGAFAVDDPDVDKLSKVIRNVMTRLNAEVARSIAFYRSQQEGNAPVRVLLTGASAQLPYMQNFFEEKLQVETEFLNPFNAVGFPQSVDPAQFGADAFSLASLVGLALRRGLSCPAEISLVSQESVARREMRSRFPFFIIGAVGVVLTFVIWLVYCGLLLKPVYVRQNERAEERIAQFNAQKSRFDAAKKTFDAAEKRVKAYDALLEKRAEWNCVMVALNRSIPMGLWLTNLKSIQTNGVLSGLRLDVASWNDVADRVKTPGKTIAETVATKLAGQPVFGEDTSKMIKKTSADDAMQMTTLNLEVSLRRAEEAAKAAASAKKTTRRGR